MFLLGFKEKSSLPFLRSKTAKVTLWDLIKVVVPNSEQSWINAISNLDNDPSMGKDADMKFRSFICVLLKSVLLFCFYLSLGFFFFILNFLSFSFFTRK